MRIGNNRRLKFKTGEKKLYSFALVCLIVGLIIRVFCSAAVGNLKMSVEKIKYEINAQEKKNESLTMKVNELTSYDKIKDVVKEMGLAYNNDNIIIINQ